MTEKTHYRKAFNSPYLSSADIVEPTNLTISCVKYELEKTKGNKGKDHLNIAYFKEKEIRKGEPLKPMVLNVQNCKTLKGFARSHFIDDWNNIPITVYVDPNVRFGRDIVEGLRISSEQPEVKKRELTPDMKDLWSRAVQAYIKNRSIKQITDHFMISPKNLNLLKQAAENRPEA